MKNKLISFSDQQIFRVQHEADVREISFTEMIKRIVDLYYDNVTINTYACDSTAN